MKKYVIIVAGGTGNRMKSAIPKQFLTLGNKPILMHTIEAFYNYDTSIFIILIISHENFILWEDLCKKHKFNISHQIAGGGKTRYGSVKNGLELINDDGLIAVHDGVRCFVTSKLIDNVFKTAEKEGNAIPCILPKDSVRIVDNNDSRSCERTKMRLIQTPQCFRSDILKKAYQLPYRDEFTDDATLMEAAGEKIHLVEGDTENIKITTPFDLKIANALIS